MKQSRFAGTGLTAELAGRAMTCAYALYGHLLEKEAENLRKRAARKSRAAQYRKEHRAAWGNK